MEEKNYLKEYYSNKEHNLRSLVENIDLTNEEEINSIKKEINKLQKQIDLKRVDLSKIIDNSHSKQYVSIGKKNILKYRNSRNYNDYYYDLLSGVEEDYDSENSIVYELDNKIGTFVCIVGYDYDLASIITKEYSYRISKDNTSITTKFLRENVISFMENKIVSYNASNNEISEITEYLWNYLKVLDNINSNEFINTFYGVDYKGNLSLRKLRECNLKNKSFEIILKTCPTEIIDNLLEKELEKALPIHKILNISQETYF